MFGLIIHDSCMHVHLYVGNKERKKLRPSLCLSHPCSCFPKPKLDASTATTRHHFLAYFDESLFIYHAGSPAFYVGAHLSPYLKIMAQKKATVKKNSFSLSLDHATSITLNCFYQSSCRFSFKILHLRSPGWLPM